MPEPDNPARDKPVVQPRLVRFLKNRPKLVGGGLREELWEEMEQALTERRTPDKVAERGTKKAIQEAAGVADPVARRRIADAMESANEGPLEKL